MKLNLVPLLASAILLVIPLKAQIASAQSRPAEIFPILSGVELTEQQQSQIGQIRVEVRSQIQGILREEQRNRFKASLEQGEGIRKAIAAMNLTPEQATQLRQVFQSARSQYTSILTQEQKQKLRQNIRTLLLERRG